MENFISSYSNGVRLVANLRDKPEEISPSDVETAALVPVFCERSPA